MLHRNSWPLLVIIAGFTPSAAFYLPGVAPIEHENGAPVSLKVNKLTSVKNQLPYRYYFLPVCQPKVIKPKAENLGEILMGDAIENSDYQLLMNKDTKCQILCEMELTEDQRETFSRFINDEYMVNWIIDNMPASTRYLNEKSVETLQNGFPIGTEKAGRYYIYNHVSLNIKYHQNKDQYVGSRIVGFEVTPSSRVSCEDPARHVELDYKGKFAYTYDVTWTWSDTRWASRWDSYLQMKSPAQVHWLPILNSLAIMILLTGLVFMILLRTLHRDIATYNEAISKEEQEEETGWKLVHGDVFRTPTHMRLLCCSVASGVQLFGMVIVTVIGACFGFLSPSYRGGLLQSMILCYSVMGLLAGFTAARMYKLFNGEDWKLVAILTSCLYPGLFFAIFFALNLLIWGQASSGAVPFVTMFLILILWFGISVPLVFFGGYLGYLKDTIELPVRINAIARVVPQQAWFMSPWVNAMFGGLLAFASVYTELFFIMSSLWQHQFYYLFGFLFLTILILVITCAEVSIAATYFQLTSENHAWWWRAFATSAGSGGYLFLYSIYYFHARLQIERMIPTLLYFGYMAIFSITFALLTGAVGLISSFTFVKGIYGSIKVD